MIALRLALIGAGVMAFVFALRTGTEWVRWVGIACLAGALLIRLIDRMRRLRS
jgi:cytochrome b